MKKIGLIELASHNEVLSNYCQVLLTARYELIVFSNSFNRAQLRLENEKLRWIIQDPTVSGPDFLRENAELLNACELLIFITVAKHFDFYRSLHTRPPRVLVMHDVVAFISPQKEFLLAETGISRLKDIVKVLLFYLRREGQNRLRLVRSFDWLALPNLTMKKYLDQKAWKLPPTFVFDFAVHENLRYQKGEDAITRITIPGIISNKSRDYQVVLQAFQSLEYVSKIKLTLLGKPKGHYGRKIVSAFKALQSHQLEVQYFEQFVEQSEFDTVLENTDFLLLPISRFMKVGIFREMNGFTCVSGNINDMLRFGIPALLPEFYPLPKEVEPLVGRFASAEDLADKLIHWINNKEYLERRKLAGEALKNFTIEQRAKEIRGVLDKIIS